MEETAVKTPHANIAFADDMVVLHADGTASTSPRHPYADVAYLPRKYVEADAGAEGEEARTAALSRWEKGLGRVAADPILSKKLHEYLYVFVQMKAFYAFGLGQVRQDLHREAAIPAVDVDNAYLDLMTRLFSSSGVKFTHELLGMANNRQDNSLQAHFARRLLADKSLLGAAQNIMRDEVTREMQVFGTSQLLSGPDANGVLLTDADASLAAEEMKQRARFAADDPQRLQNTLASLFAEPGASRAEQPAYADRLMTLPGRGDPKLAALLELPLHNATTTVVFTKYSPDHIWPTYTSVQPSAGVYDSNTKVLIIPMDDHPAGERTFPQLVGRNLEGPFATLNDATVRHGLITAEHTWREELRHAALDQMFDNHSLPAAADDRAAWERLYRGMAADLGSGWAYEQARHYLGNMPREQMQATMLQEAAQGRSPGGLTGKVFAELPVKLMEHIEEAGWDRARADAPELMLYLEEVILPRAREIRAGQETQGADKPSPPGTPDDRLGTLDVKGKQPDPDLPDQ